MSALDSRPPESHAKPSPAVFALEGVRATAEIASFVAALPCLLRLPKGDGRPVLVIPGFTASDTSTEPLRRLLRHLDYDAYEWGQGRNLGPSPKIVDGLLERFDSIRRGTAQTVTLIGWSLGGLYSRAIAERSPADVRHVITMGSPFRLAKTQETNAGALFDLLTPIHGKVRPHGTKFRREPYTGPPKVPSTAIFTKTDGVVPWQSCIDEPGRRNENIEVLGAHSGLGHNPAALIVVADRLRLPEGTWRPFAPGRASRTVFPATPFE